MLINPNSLTPFGFLIFCLVHRVANVPITSIKKYPLLKRKLYITVSNSESTAKTPNAPVEGQIAKWNQKLDAL